MDKLISFSLVCLVILVAFAGCSSSKGTVPETSSSTITETTTPLETEIEAISTNIATITPTITKTVTPTATKTATNTVTATPTKASTSYTVCSCSGDVYNCGDFDDWKSAQTCYDYCVSLGKGDVHKLDRNDDGCACEINDGCSC